MSLTEFLILAQDPTGFATKLAEFRATTEEMARRQSTLKAAQAEHDA
jgi:hypothetical protein